MSARSRSSDDDRLLLRVLEEASHGDRHLFDGLTEHEKKVVVKMLSEIRDTGECPTLDLLWEVDYRERPVSIQTFLTDPAYLGYQDRDWLYPAWREALYEMFEPGRKVWELILTGSIGVGKTTIAVVAQCYKTYLLSCLRDPQSFYEMSPGSPIVIGLYNVFKYKTQTTSYAYLTAFVDHSPYFKTRWPRDPRKTSQMVFPNNISVIHGSSELHALGENLYGCIIDETDFMRGGATNEDKGQAYNLYTSTVRRIESRFGRLGDIPGLLCLISSKTDQAGFIEQRIEAKANDPHVYVCDKPLWEVKPGRYSGRKFYVFVGDAYHDSRILTDEEAEDPPAGKVVGVPIEHRQPFEEDLEQSLRDIAGIATISDLPLIPSRDDIFACIDKSRKHPFSKSELSITINSDDVVEDFLDHTKLCRIQRSVLTPIVNPGAARYVHIDFGVTNDSVGFAMGHVAGFRTIRKRIDEGDVAGQVTEFQEPYIYIDLMLRVAPSRGTRIDWSKIRQFVHALNNSGFSIELVTFDGWNSEDSLQHFLKAGMKAEVFSMDRLPNKEGHPYSYLRQAILERRVSYYHYDRFLIEVVSLRRELKPTPSSQGRYKVDHPPFMLDLDGHRIRGGKDVSDAVGAVVRHCMVLGAGSRENALPMVGSGAPAGRRNYRPPAPRSFANEDWLTDDYDAADRVRGLIP